MRKRKLDAPVNKVNTIIGQGSIFKGTIESEGIVRIDGEMEGDVVSRGDVVIGEGAKAKINITAKNVIIAGTMEGTADASGKLEIKETGVLTGCIRASDISIVDGGKFSGSSEMRINDQSGK